MKNKGLRVFAVIFVVLFVILALDMFLGMMNTYETVLKENWGLEFPDSAGLHETYSADSGASFNGDGIRYHVFSCRNISLAESSLSLSADDSETIFAQSRSQAFEEWLDSLGVPSYRRPDYSSCVSWYSCQIDNSEIIIYIDTEDGIMYVGESFL